VIDQGTQAGTFQEFEQDTIERVFAWPPGRLLI
jgi:hypothetical protein